MKLSKRELFVVSAALAYAQSNVGDINETLMDDDGDPPVIKIRGGDFAGTLLRQGEVEALAEKFAEAGVKAR